MIEFDPEKERACRHRLPFAFAAQIFEGRYVETVDDRFDYGETRIVAVGMIASLGFLYTTVYTWRADRSDGSSVLEGQAIVIEKSIMTVTPEVTEEARRRITPELVAWLDALTDDDIDAMVAADPDAGPGLDDPIFYRAVWVTPFKDAAE